MSVKVVVLDDGDTWAGSAEVYTITRDAYDRLCDGARIRDLSDADILSVEDLETRED
jgi:hypothetical protein